MELSRQSLRKRIAILLSVGGVIVAVSFVSGWYFGYESWNAWWIANFFHLSAGAYAFYLVRSVYLYTKPIHRTGTVVWMEALLFFAVVLMLGVFWEWFEFIVFDRYRVWFIGLPSVITYGDTIGDLFLDALGAAIAGLIFLRRGKEA